MSTDSSSSTPSNYTGAIAYARATLTVLGTIGLFIFGQLLGITILLTGLAFAGLETDQVTNLFNDNVYAQFAAVLMVSLTTIALLVGWHKYRDIDFLKAIRLSRMPSKNDAWVALKAYAVYLLSFIGIVLVLPVLLPVVDVDQTQQLGFESPVGVEYLFVFFSLVILPPLVEEILFRGFLFERLRQYIKLPVAIGITSVLFAIAHLEFFSDASLNWIAAIDTFVLSLFLIWVYIKTESLWAAIFLHGIKNAVAYVAIFLL